MKAFSEHDRQQFLHDVRVAVLSVAADNGRPPASVPIWYDYADGLIRISTGASSRKARLIREAGVVTLVVQREEPPYQYVVVEGTVVDTTTPTPPDLGLAIAVRYLGEDGGHAFMESMRDVGNVMFTVRPDRWMTADFSDDL